MSDILGSSSSKAMAEDNAENAADVNDTAASEIDRREPWSSPIVSSHLRSGVSADFSLRRAEAASVPTSTDSNFLWHEPAGCSSRAEASPSGKAGLISALPGTNEQRCR